ncbi:MAG: PaaI family thioesterase [Dehalococcoidales bacterium]|nr:PaaI family thioesterase [Dehalococcoidales bacterium]
MSPKPEQDFVQELKTRGRDEPIASFLDMKLVEFTPGYAKVRMPVKKEYLNFNGYIFGGIIMSLVDQAFAYATNSLNFPSVASQINIHFMAAPEVGDELIGECRVLKSGRRAAVSEMTVSGKDGKLIAKATGTTIPINDSGNR